MRHVNIDKEKYWTISRPCSTNQIILLTLWKRVDRTPIRDSWMRPDIPQRREGRRWGHPPAREAQGWQEGWVKACLRHQFPPVFTDTGGPWLMMVVAVVLMRDKVSALLTGCTPRPQEGTAAASAQQGWPLPRSLSRHSSSGHLSWPSAPPFPQQWQAFESVPWWCPEQPSSLWVMLSPWAFLIIPPSHLRSHGNGTVVI